MVDVGSRRCAHDSGSHAFITVALASNEDAVTRQSQIHLVVLSHRLGIGVIRINIGYKGLRSQLRLALGQFLKCLRGRIREKIEMLEGREPCRCSIQFNTHMVISACLINRRHLNFL